MSLNSSSASARHDRLDRGQNFGAITATVAAADLFINAADHAAGMVVPRHEHANPYVCVVMAGCVEVHARQTIECPVGSVIAYPMGHAHSNRFGDRLGRCINIHLGPSWTHERLMREWLGECRHLRLGTGSRSLVRLGLEIRASDSAAPLAAASAAIELIAEAMRTTAPAPHPKWLERVIDIVEADLAHAPTLGRLAAEIGTHPAHVARLFHRTYGETIGAYVRRRRVEEADHSLTASELTLAEIALAAGFADQSHFTRVFRRHFGVPPGARRRNSRSKPRHSVQDDAPGKR